MRRFPLIPTMLVTLAVAAMIGLGLWQLLDRLPQKQAFLIQLADNPGKPPVAFPDANDESLLFRQTRGACRPPLTVTLAGAGAAGFRRSRAARAGRSSSSARRVIRWREWRGRAAR